MLQNNKVISDMLCVFLVVITAWINNGATSWETFYKVFDWFTFILLEQWMLVATTGHVL